jgi:hypothetical protein
MCGIAGPSCHLLLSEPKTKSLPALFAQSGQIFRPIRRIVFVVLIRRGERILDGFAAGLAVRMPANSIGTLAGRWRNTVHYHFGFVSSIIRLFPRAGYGYDAQVTEILAICVW